MNENKLLTMIIAILAPPVAVFLVSGLTKIFWINLLLTFLFFVPGAIHALIVTNSGTTR